MKDEIINIQWWCGSYRGKWKKETTRVDGSLQLNKEDITKRQVIVRFQWKGAEERTLPNSLKEQLKKKYVELSN